MNTFDGVRLSVKHDIGRAERPSGSVVVNCGRPQLAELGEKFMNVGIGNTKVQVGNNKFARA